MYVVIIPDLKQQTQFGEEEILPEAYGPYESYFEAVGQAIDIIRAQYDDEPEFSFCGFGEHFENSKMLVNHEGELYLGATINKLG